jgi:hypothetical protein
MSADTPADRKQLLVGRIVEARRTGGPTTFEAEDIEVTYGDRTIELEVTPDARDRLESILSEYHVFKIQQPETRKADDGVVVLSAVTDAKRAADFVESLFREVHGLDERYALRASDEP